MFPFFNNYPGTDLHEIDLAYILKLCAELRASNTTLTTWKAAHEVEYDNLRNDVDGLINNLVDVISPWDSSIAYHVFSIVEYQGTNYIAVQDVPVGTMITNTDYWQPANTVTEQINAMSVIVSHLQNMKFWGYPEDYGAAGDGVTDDSAAVQNCIANYDVSVLYGKYNLAGTVINVPSDKIIIIYGEVITAENEAFNATGSANIIIKGGTFTGDNASDLESAIIIDGSNNVLIDGLTISDFLNKGIDVRNGSNIVSVNNCTISGASGSSGAGVSVHGYTTENINISDVKVKDSRIGVTVNGSHHISISDVIIDNCNVYGVGFDGVITNSGDGAHDCTVTNVIINNDNAADASLGAFYLGNAAYNISVSDFAITGGNIGIRCVSNASVRIRNSSFVNGSVYNSGTYGISISASEDILVTSVTVSNAATRGATLFAAERIIFSACKFISSVVGAFVQGSANCSFGNCIFSDNSTNDLTIAYGGSVSPVNNIFTGCSFLSASNIVNSSIPYISAGCYMAGT